MPPPPNPRGNGAKLIMYADLTAFRNLARLHVRHSAVTCYTVLLSATSCLLFIEYLSSCSGAYDVLLQEFHCRTTTSQKAYPPSLPANRIKNHPIQVNPSILYYQLPELPIPAPRLPDFTPNLHLCDTRICPLLATDIVDQNNHLL